MRLLSHSIRRLAFAGGLAAALPGCTDFSTTPDSLGHVTVSVTNQNNAGVQGLVVDLLMQDKVTVWRSIRTGSNGGGEFGSADGGVIAQAYYVRLDPGTSWEITPPDTNDKPVVVVIGQSYAITFKVRPKGTGGGPPT